MEEGEVSNKATSNECGSCAHCYLERPKMIAHICAHPKMIRRFDVTPFVKRKEKPQRCPEVGR